MLDKKLNKLSQKKKKLDKYKPLPQELVKNLNQWYKVKLTYTSNAIEGNTLSEDETALIIEKGITIGGKTVIEHLEVINHAKAVDYIQTLTQKSKEGITENEILEIHRLILSGINEKNAGKYRSVSVRIAGYNVIFPNPEKVPQLMEKFMGWLHLENKEHPVKIAADAHFKLVSIHPFVDGNGRVSRLLMNLLLMQAGYPPAVIRVEDRKQYLDSLQKGQVNKNLEDYYIIIYDAVNKSLDMYLESLGND